MVIKMEVEVIERDTLTLFFRPKSVAVIGSLRETWYGGYVTIKHLQTFGFSGRIYPVNPSYKEVLGMKVYPDMKQVPEPVDLAVIITPARVVPEIIKDCAENGVRAAIVVSDGFAERDDEGAKLQQEIVNIAQKASIRILGPNTIGTVDTTSGLVTAQYETNYRTIKKGAVALCAQSGMVGPQALPLEDLRYGISKICDYGNKCDVNETDILEYLAEDPETRVIAMHIEDVKDGPRFLRVARETVRKKPILLAKPGRTEEAKKALRSHTGALAGEDRIYAAALRQAGVLRVESIEDLLEFSKLFALQPLPKGNRIAVITASGAYGILAIDTAIEYGLSLSRLSEGSAQELRSIFPTLGKNPIDIFTAPFENLWDLYRKVIKIVLGDENVDCALIVLHAGFLTDSWKASQIGEALRDLEILEKPVAIWIYGTRLSSVREFSIHLEDMGFPVFHHYLTAVKALGLAAKYSTYIKGGYDDDSSTRASQTNR